MTKYETLSIAQRNVSCTAHGMLTDVSSLIQELASLMDYPHEAVIAGVAKRINVLKDALPELEARFAEFKAQSDGLIGNYALPPIKQTVPLPEGCVPGEQDFEIAASGA